MSHSSPRSRIAGGAVLGAALLILPLTASISYAASETAQEAPEPPAPPVPPAPPFPPEAPQPPEAPEPGKQVRIITIDPDAPEGAQDAEVIERVIRDEDGKEKRVRMVIRRGPEGEKLGDPEAHEAMLAEMREELAEADRALADLPRIMAEAQAEADGARAAGQQRVIVRHECKPGSEEVSETTTTKGGAQIVSICQSRVFASARKGLEEARAEIAADKDIPEETRKQILKELDRTIARWNDKEG